MSSPLFNGLEFTQRLSAALGLGNQSIKSIHIKTNTTEPPEAVITKSITQEEASRLFALLSCYNLIERSTDVI